MQLLGHMLIGLAFGIHLMTTIELDGGPFVLEERLGGVNKFTSVADPLDALNL